MATLTSLGFTIFSRYDGSGVSRANRDLNDLNHTLERNTGGLNNFTGRMSAAVAAAAAFAPALVPVTAAVTSVTAATVAMGVSAGSALAVYGIAVQGAIQRTLEMAEAGRALTPVQATFVSGVNNMKAAWDRFIVSTQNQTLAAATQVVIGLTAGIARLKPVVDAVHPSIMAVATAFRAWMESEQGLGRFINTIIQVGVPALNSLIRAGRDVLAVLGIGFRAFAPLGIQVAQILERGAAAMRKWAEGGGFQRFIDNVRANAPAIRAFFDALWAALKNVGAAMAGLGPLSLQLATALLKIIAAMPPGLIQALAVAFVAWRIAATGMLILNAVATAAAKAVVAFQRLSGVIRGMSLTAMVGPWGIIVAIVLAFAAAVFLAWKHSEPFREAVKGLGEALKELWNAIMPANLEFKTFGSLLGGLLGLIGQFAGAVLTMMVNSIRLGVEMVTFLVNGLKQLFAWFVQFMGTIPEMWNNFWNGLVTVAKMIWTGLTIAWNAFITGLMIVWNAISTALRIAWDTVWNAMSIVVRTIWTALTTAWNGFITGLSIVWNAVSTGLRIAWSAIWTAIQVVATTIWNALKVAWNALCTAFTTVWNTVSAAFRIAWSAIWTAIQVVATTIWNALKVAWNAVCTAFMTVWNTLGGALRTAWNAIWTAIRVVGETIWNALKFAWNAVCTAFITVWNTIGNALRTAFTAVWQAIQSTANTIWNWLRDTWTAILRAIQSAANTIWTWLRDTWTAIWRAIQSTANTIWNWLRDTWATILRAVQSAANTIWTWLRDTWLEIWRAIQNTANTIWNWLKNTWNSIMDAIKKIWDTFSKAFSTAWKNTWDAVQDTAKKVWDAIKTIVRNAVNAVIKVANGLITGFNAITKALGMNLSIDKIPEVNFAAGGMVGKMPQFSAGGTVNFTHGGAARGYSPGRDRIPAMLSPGEGVLTPEAVRGLGGPGFIHSANRKWAGHRGAGKGAKSFRRYQHHAPKQGKGSWHGANMDGHRHFALGGMALPLEQQALPGGAPAMTPSGLMEMFFAGSLPADVAAALARAGVSSGLITQGSYSTGVAASAGTHDGGGVVDLGTTNPAVLAALRAAGFAAWIRTPAQGFSPHIHAVLIGGAGLSPGAAAQVQDYLAGGDGLGVAGDGGGGGGLLDLFAPIMEHAGEILKGIYGGMPLMDSITKFAGDALGGILEMFGIGGDDGGGLFGSGIGPDLGPDILPDIGGAINDVASGALGFMGDMIKGALLMAMNATNVKVGVSDAQEDLDSMGLPGGFMTSVVANMGGKWIKGAIDWLVKKAAEMVPALNLLGMGAAGGGGVQQWAPLAAMALGMAGIPLSQLGAFLALMQAESGGNPMAINNWDSNAAAGMASRGLMQVIPPTFAAYHVPGTSTNIFDPLANMAAAANYIKHVYGGIVPGSPYARGTGFATRGWHMVGERGPEMVRFRGGENVESWKKTRDLFRNGRREGGEGTENHWHEGAFKFEFKGPVTEDALRYAESDMCDKLRMAVQAGVGKRNGR